MTSSDSPELIEPLSLNELHELRRKILHENYEPDVNEMQRAVQSVRVARPLPEEKPAKKTKKPVVKVDLDDLLS